MGGVMTSLTDQTILVTGATDGVGRALAAEIARNGATVLVHGRDQARVTETIEEIRAATGRDRLRPYLADFADLAQIRALAEPVLAAEPRLDALVSNAGIGGNVPGGGARMESPDGYELRFAVNYLAGFLLTRLLLPLLRSSAPARIVNVSSLGQHAIDFGDVMLTSSYNGGRAYAQSKLAQILDTIDLAGQLDGTGVTVNALHPATYMPTKIVASPFSTIAEGVEATRRLVGDPALDGVTGRFFNGLREARADPQAYDPDARRRLRELSEKLTGLPPS
jgi:NAD(P)-dependent dehydrogenase (short-subunit alcohol dehydrogenase family)